MKYRGKTLSLIHQKDNHLRMMVRTAIIAVIIALVLLIAPFLSLAEFDASNYPRSKQLSPSMKIFWNINETSIMLAMQVVRSQLGKLSLF